MPMRILSLCAVVLGLVCLTSSATAAPVPDALRTELRLLAEDIAKIVEKNGGGAVAIGEFTGSVEVAGHAGPGIQLMLAEELAVAKVTIDHEKHRFEVSGRYQPFHDTPDSRMKAGGNPAEASGLFTVKLVAFVIDKETGDILAERPTGRLIFGSEAVPGLLGLGTSNPPTDDARKLSGRFQNARENPQVEIRETQITGQSGRYALEVIVRDGDRYVARSITLEKGNPFVDLKVSDIYGVRLINHSDHEAAVDLRIDGVNVFAFSETKSRYWIIPPRSHTDVKGWHKTTGTSIEFKVVADFPDTAAAKLKLKPSASIGLITASFSACWTDDSQRPADEPLVQGRGTGFGDEIDLKTKQVSRTIGQIRDNLAVRYER